MSTGPDPQPDLGRGRALATPGFADDDGSADPVVRAALADRSGAEGGVIALARLLRTARLLSCVVAVAEEVDHHGGDSSSHMAAVSMVNERGEKGLLAFTGVDSLAAWSPTARPVPALGREMAQAAIADGSAALVIDVAGPLRRIIGGAALRTLADELDLEQVSVLVREALGPLTASGRVCVHVGDSRDEGPADVLVTVSEGGPEPVLAASDVVVAAARLISASTELTALVPGGIGVTRDTATGPTGP